MLGNLAEFVKIVELGSVSAAARDLGLPRASLSRRLSKLESEYGVRLLHRDTHHQTLTRAGLELYKRGRSIVEDLKEAKAAVSALDSEPRGLLRVGWPPSSGIEMLVAKEYLKVCPNVRLEYVATHTHDDLFSNQIDLAFRADPSTDERLMRRKVASFESFLYGAPELIDQLGQPALETLDQFPFILGFDAFGKPLTSLPLLDGGCVPIEAKIHVNRMDSSRSAALLGLGFAVLSERLVRPDVEAGLLRPVLAETIGSKTNVGFVWPERDFELPKVRAFIDIASETIKRLYQERYS